MQPSDAISCSLVHTEKQRAGKCAYDCLFLFNQDFVSLQRYWVSLSATSSQFTAYLV